MNKISNSKWIYRFIKRKSWTHILKLFIINSSFFQMIFDFKFWLDIFFCEREKKK